MVQVLNPLPVLPQNLHPGLQAWANGTKQWLEVFSRASASLAGNQQQPFSVGDAVSAHQAVALDQFPAVLAATPGSIKIPVITATGQVSSIIVNWGVVALTSGGGPTGSTAFATPFTTPYIAVLGDATAQLSHISTLATNFIQVTVAAATTGSVYFAAIGV